MWTFNIYHILPNDSVYWHWAPAQGMYSFDGFLTTLQSLHQLQYRTLYQSLTNDKGTAVVPVSNGSYVAKCRDSYARTRRVGPRDREGRTSDWEMHLWSLKFRQSWWYLKRAQSTSFAAIHGLGTPGSLRGEITMACSKGWVQGAWWHWWLYKHHAPSSRPGNSLGSDQPCWFLSSHGQRP